MGDIDIHEIDVLTEYFEYLDELHESGDTNMFGASPYLQREFALEDEDAGAVLTAWMLTFSRDTTAWKRAERAKARGETDSTDTKCPRCNGTGQITSARDLLARSPVDEQEYQKQLAQSRSFTCPLCKGTGETDTGEV